MLDYDNIFLKIFKKKIFKKNFQKKNFQKKKFSKKKIFKKTKKILSHWFKEIYST